MDTSSAVYQLSCDSYRSDTQFQQGAFLSLKGPHQAIADLGYVIQFSRHKMKIRCSINLDLYLQS